MSMLTCRQVDRTGHVSPVSLPNSSVTLYGPIEIDPSVVLGAFVSIGYPKEQRLLDEQKTGTYPCTRIRAHVCVGCNVTLGEGCILHEHVSVDDHVRVGFNCEVAPRARLLYGAYICDRVVIGSRAKVAGFVCDAAQIGDDCTVMGDLVHDYSSPHISWGIEEPSPIISARTVVGYGAKIVGGVQIGHNSYIAAGALVTRDVPPRSLVRGINEVVPADEWHGAKLGPEFWNWIGHHEQ